MNAKKKTRRDARRLFRLCLGAGILNEARAREVAALIGGSGRRGSVPMLGEFLRLVRLEVDRHTALVESAVALPPDLREGLSARLARRHGPGIETTFVLNPALLAGIRIKVGSEVYDGSVRARLAALEARL